MKSSTFEQRFLRLLTDNDKLVYVNKVSKGKLRPPANRNSIQQFSNSPDLNGEIMEAIMEALEAHETISWNCNSLSGRTSTIPLIQA